MSLTLNPKKRPRGERHSAAWGKRVALALVLLVTNSAFGLELGAPARVGKFGPDLAPTLARAGKASANETVRVIVQYRVVPTDAHYATMRNRGALLHSKLHMIKGAAFTIPVRSLPLLEADPEIVSVTIDHPMKEADDLTNGAIGTSSAWNSGYTGAGVTVAV
ncbi:MAG: hypothetical protein WAK22_00215, partial [Candidatus Sulfotelmatobacter sp.]